MAHISSTGALRRGVPTLAHCLDRDRRTTEIERDEQCVHLDRAITALAASVRGDRRPDPFPQIDPPVVSALDAEDRCLTITEPRGAVAELGETTDGLQPYLAVRTPMLPAVDDHNRSPGESFRWASSARADAADRP